MVEASLDRLENDVEGVSVREGVVEGGGIGIRCGG